MMVKFNHIDFSFTNPIISIGNVSFDVRKAEEFTKHRILSHEGELARLYLNILGWPETIVGTRTIKKRQGIDISTATFNELKSYLDSPIKKSESIRQLVRKCIRLKYRTDFQTEKTGVSDSLKNEYELIDNETQNIDSLGRCGGGVFGKVRLDGSTDRIPRRIL